MAMQEAPRKRRKWDDGPAVPVPGVGMAGSQAGVATAAFAYGVPGVTTVRPAVGILPMDAIRRAQEAAAILAKAAPQLHVPTGPRVIAREVNINDAPGIIRAHLTKRSAQDEIMQRTHTNMVVKGRYYPPGSAVDEREKPLHLYVTPGAGSGLTDESRLACVDAAVAELEHILNATPGHPS
eukprot:gene22465-29582_t